MYKHILVAVDLSKEGGQVVSKGLILQQMHSCQLSLVHVIEPISYAYGDIAINAGEIQQQLTNASDDHLNSIVEDNNLTNTTCITLNGRAADEIHRYAEENKVDLILTGSHGRHGLQLLLGSTANGILHGAKCDVLAVRIQDKT
jgi:universal stress protein A